MCSPPPATASGANHENEDQYLRRGRALGLFWAKEGKGNSSSVHPAHSSPASSRNPNSFIFICSDFRLIWSNLAARVTFPPVSSSALAIRSFSSAAAFWRTISLSPVSPLGAADTAPPGAAPAVRAPLPWLVAQRTPPPNSL